MPEDRAQSHADREQLIRSAVYEFLTLRQSATFVSQEEFERKYRDLMPDLRDALRTGIERHGQFLAIKQQLSSATTAESSLPAVAGFVLSREIGVGGQGTVYEAVQLSTAQTVAIKVIQSDSRHVAQRFEREVQSLAKLCHPNIVGVIDCGRTAQGCFYVAMQFVRGLNLSQWLLSSPSSLRALIQLFAEIASALAESHRQGIIHRDLKPTNILINEAGHPVLVDFGMARLADGLQSQQLTNTGNIVGTVEWLSPEQASGRSKHVGPASDIYSFGLLLYFAMTGSAPYSTTGPVHQVIRNICHAPPRPISKKKILPFGPVDERLTLIVGKCLEKDPGRRYTSADDLHRDVSEYLEGRPAFSRPKRRTWIAAASSVVVLFVAAAWELNRPAKTTDFPRSASLLESVSNSVGMKLIRVPAGRFRMGSLLNSRSHRDDEDPHVVQLTHTFFLSDREVSQSQYAAVMTRLPDGIKIRNDPLPVDQVSWVDAVEFCKRLGVSEGRNYVLPTEAQWEYACSNGGADDNAATRSQVGSWTVSNSGGTLHPIGSQPPNAWGFFDMSGNVAEYVADSYVQHLGFGAMIDPKFTSPPQSVVVKGGSFRDSADECLRTHRSYFDAKTAFRGVGFRIAWIADDFKS